MQVVFLDYENNVDVICTVCVSNFIVWTHISEFKIKKKNNTKYWVHVGRGAWNATFFCLTDGKKEESIL